MKTKTATRTLTTVAEIVALPPGSLVTHIEYPVPGAAKEVVLRKWDGGYGPRPNAWHVADAGEHRPRTLTEADLPVTLLRCGT
jgi:hypothetical protein